ncbi:hypothetical protein CHH27_23090 [Labrenzia sp. VG12]|nr:hypothetical protein CHH27_23090 [Labrenzia sp. VG12]
MVRSHAAGLVDQSPCVGLWGSIAHVADQVELPHFGNLAGMLQRGAKLFVSKILTPGVPLLDGMTELFSYCG